MKKSLVPSPYDFLSPQQKKLVDAYVDPQNGFDQKLALEKAGYNRHSDTRSGMNPFRHSNVRRAISEKIKPVFDRTGITFEENLKYVASIAYGDPRELAETVKTNCRYCKGTLNKYQWTESEYYQKIEKEIEDFKRSKNITGVLNNDQLDELGFVPTSADGGFGFDKWGEPDLSCPDCHGNGIDRIYIHTQHITHPLYAGVKVDKNGNIEVMIRNQDHALKLLAQLSGFLVERVEIKEVVTADSLAEKRKRAIERKDARDAKAQK